MQKNLPSLAGVFSMAVALLAHDDFSFFVADSEFTSALRLVVKPNEVSGHLITLSGLTYLEVLPLKNSLLTAACYQVTNLAIIT
jgi:hypothetical protein